MRQAAHESGHRLLQVHDVYQVAERDSKAFVTDFATGEGIDVWFWCWMPVSGALVAVAGSFGHGEHHSRRVLYIGDPTGHGVLAAMTAVELHAALIVPPWLP